MVYADGVVRVRVEKVIVGVAEVPLSTYKIQYVRKALNTFIAWPTPLVNLVSDEDSVITPNKVTQAVEGVNDVAIHDPLRELIKSLIDIYGKSIQFVWDVSKFGIPNVDSSLFLTYVDVNKITSGDKCISMSGVIAWVMYRCMDSLSLNPYTMQRTDVGNVKTILKNGLRNRTDRAHWQLVVLRLTNNVVVWFCSLHKRSDVNIKTAINKLSNIF
ncbi:hypothetical protein GmHk_20G057302 [Glycine max]|nr:hypothetical protein GmHk_20G057302 [Glycine max]KAH1189558.1 hypothetical protein GmHk_20G057302 [Glycine max]KAH1189559.1 hypothetical protein GmHk_20G057302 [Glycine max]KAH1189560.1 hypothetical protein GmHk_20G057302 [Glycine max]